jgi:hypothetical protein
VRLAEVGIPWRGHSPQTVVVASAACAARRGISTCGAACPGVLVVAKGKSGVHVSRSDGRGGLGQVKAEMEEARSRAEAAEGALAEAKQTAAAAKERAEG